MRSPTLRIDPPSSGYTLSCLLMKSGMVSDKGVCWELSAKLVLTGDEVAMEL